ncbi:MAG TPA: hypothetical protein VKU19_03270 [Bryobacteraceae bacterium]|nr:hypothetical protein [Bryobacteraceae bacterium]
MQRYLALLTLLPCGLFAQAVTQLSPLEYRPASPDTTRRGASRRPLSFDRGIVATPAPFRLGMIRQSEIDAVERDPMLTLRGIERGIDRRAGQHGAWVTLDDGSTAWRLAIQSDGAAGVRLHFTGFAVGIGEVWIYSSDHTQVFGPYTAEGPDGSGDFWSHAIFADTVVVEYLPEQPRDTVPFHVAGLLHVLTGEQLMAAGSCELDVSCYPDWNAVASGVGLYFFQKGGAGYACSGALVNNTNSDGKPYFLSANHCVSDAATAKTVDVFWNYQTSTCNGAAPNLVGLPQTLGATWLASAGIPSGDYSLMLLSPLPNIKLTFYGWNAGSTALNIGDAATGIHHPQADYKRIAFGVRDPDMAAQVGTDYAPASMYYQVRETAGRIEPGSSGSPLFTTAKALVGTLTYGPGGNACSISPFSAGYARFSVALPALTTWLTPAPPTSSGSGSTAVTMTPSSVKTNWTISTAAPLAQGVQIATASTSPVALTIKANQAWILPSTTSLTVAQGKPASLAISFNTQSFTAAGAYIGSVSVTGTGISQSITVEVDVAAAAAVKGGPMTVIPYFVDGLGTTTTFTLINPYGTQSVASLSFATSGGAAISIPVGTAMVSWQNITLPPFGTAIVSTVGSSSPQKSGMALVQSGDQAKRIQAWAQINNNDIVGAGVNLMAPFSMPFDATSAAGTTLYVFNPSSTATLTLSLSIYDNTGAAVGSGSLTIPPQQEGVLPMTRTAAVFGGRKGLVYVTGGSSVSAIGVHTATDGRISSVAPGQ